MNHQRRLLAGTLALTLPTLALLAVSPARAASRPASITASYASKQQQLTITGTPADDTVTVSATASGNLVVNGGTVPIKGGTATLANTALIIVSGQAGNDHIAGDPTIGTVAVRFDGGDGDDTLVGSAGTDTLIGGAGQDSVTGGRGNDTIDLGIGNDGAVWNPGDGSDAISGGDGNDLLQFNGANAGERFDLSGTFGGLVLTRDVGTVRMDLGSIERIDLAVRGGQDSVTAHDLSGTGLTAINIDDDLTTGGPDGAGDAFSFEGTSGNDQLTPSLASDQSIIVQGLPYALRLFGSDGASDSLTLSGDAGDDVIDATGLFSGWITLAAFGGEGNDVLIGTPAFDSLFGGLGDDVLEGRGGGDFLDGGGGSDIIIP